MRPALTRALAAHGDRPARAQARAARSSCKARISSAAPSSRRSATTRAPTRSRRSREVAKLDGPLQDDAVLALGKIGDKRALETFAALQRTAPKSVAAGDRRGDLPARRELRLAPADTSATALKFAHRPDRVSRSCCARRLRPRRRWRSPGDEDAVADADRRWALRRRDPARAPIALALGTVALRNTPLAAAGARAAAESRRRRSSCCAKPSTCSRRTSRRSGSSSTVRRSLLAGGRRARRARKTRRSADPEARVLSRPWTTSRPASTSTPATKSSAASARSRAARSRPACSPTSDRSAACSASMPPALHDPVLVVERRRRRHQAAASRS